MLGFGWRYLQYAQLLNPLFIYLFYHPDFHNCNWFRALLYAEQTKKEGFEKNVVKALSVSREAISHG